MPDTVRLERGSGHTLIVCTCGWRDMAFTEAAITAAVHDHKALVHGDHRAASSYAAVRKHRAR